MKKAKLFLFVVIMITATTTMASVTFTVTDPSNLPVKNAAVTVAGVANPVITDAYGHASFDIIPNGQSYTMTYGGTNYSKTGGVTSTSMSQTINPYVGWKSTIKIKVVDKDGNPLQNATVAGTGISAKTTAADGTVSFPNTSSPANDYVMHLSGPGDWGTGWGDNGK